MAKHRPEHERPGSGPARWRFFLASAAAVAIVATAVVTGGTTVGERVRSIPVAHQIALLSIPEPRVVVRTVTVTRTVTVPPATALVNADGQIHTCTWIEPAQDYFCP